MLPPPSPAMLRSTTSRNLMSTGAITTIKERIVKCDDCGELNVQLFGGSPFEDGASVLIRYMMNSCKFTKLSCRPYECGDERPVQIVLNGNLTTVTLNSSLSVEMACKNGRWYNNQTDIAIDSVSCIYNIPRTSPRCFRKDENQKSLK
ncbi:hypothetical protein KIN20_019380 [Parelaphostrongylus tenuis]|uniref:C6 domain-containing protein n=1 Tax=Parelaphostrongylus tenuis TaxID=148309 RepID=A0AAD5QQ77_PARTN|nr:hypothetical protein KIN20_019380 [Parelaphostrongylus tenuis]